MSKIQIKYSEKQRVVLLSITCAEFAFTNTDGRAINSILHDISRKFAPFPKKELYRKSLKYHEGHALVKIMKILMKEQQEPLIIGTSQSIIQQIEPKL